jgi:hypothetical protein
MVSWSLTLMFSWQAAFHLSVHQVWAFRQIVNLFFNKALIGKPALPALVGLIEKHDEKDLESAIALSTIVAIFGEDVAGRAEYIREALAKASLPEAKQRLSRVAEKIEALERTRWIKPYYRAMALHFNPGRAEGKPETEILDNIASDMNAVLAERSPRARSPKMELLPQIQLSGLLARAGKTDGWTFVIDSIIKGKLADELASIVGKAPAEVHSKITKRVNKLRSSTRKLGYMDGLWCRQIIQTCRLHKSFCGAA